MHALALQCINQQTKFEVPIFTISKDMIGTKFNKKLSYRRGTARRNCSNQEERRHDKTLAHTINVQTVTDNISRRVTSGRENTSLILLDHGVKVIEGCYRNVVLL